MQRITDKNLQAVVDRINRITGSPENYRSEDGSTSIGHYCLDGAYGVYRCIVYTRLVVVVRTSYPAAM